MTPILAKLRSRGAVALLAALGLAGCVDSAAPLLTGTQPVLGPRLRVHVYTLKDGPASGPEIGTFRWDGTQYRVVGRPTMDIAAFTLAPYRGDDLIVQAKNSRPQVKGIEYALARKVANEVYLLSDINEDNADDATRAEFCTKNQWSICWITERAALMAFVDATAAKPDPKGALAIIVGETGH